MISRIPTGVWPTMITPYHADGSIDYAALEALIDWYIVHGADGLFAVCQSSMNRNSPFAEMAEIIFILNLAPVVRTMGVSPFGAQVVPEW